MTERRKGRIPAGMKSPGCVTHGEEFSNILDLFRFAERHGMCMEMYCTTCGALEFRSLCRKLGSERIRELLEATTDGDLSAVHPSFWFDPLRLILHDGNFCRRDCPIMERYGMGYEALVYGPSVRTLTSVEDTRIFAMHGSIFDMTEAEGLALFENPGLAALPTDIKAFLRKHGLPEIQGELMDCGKQLGKVRSVYYMKTADARYGYSEVEKIIFGMLEEMSDAMIGSVAMNGIRTNEHSEKENVMMICRWLSIRPYTSIKKIFLVDRRGGFNTLIIKDYIPHS